MSYDLFFTKPRITAQEFEQYFDDRNNYRIEGNQAWYENEDTGVYFNFDYSDEESEDPDVPEGSLSFTLNYCRPHFFALEAEPEVREVVEYFGFAIEDPQENIAGDGMYTTEGFLRGWNQGNEFGYRTVLKPDALPGELCYRPTDELQSIWEWNCSIQSVQESLGDNIFVPRIIFIRVKGNLYSTVVWSDACSTLLPHVDAMVIFRKKFAPRKFLKRKTDMCIMSFDKALPIVESYASNQYSLPAFSLSYDVVPSDIQDFVRYMPNHNGSLERIGMDQILNQELIDRFKKGEQIPEVNG